jgi:hypothetical protein
MDNIGEDIPILVAQTGPLNNQRWSLKSTAIVGRDESCDIVIPSRQVSRQHIRLEPAAQGVFLEDLGSKNGTYLNGQIIREPTLLKDGDVLQVALAQQFIFLSSDATLPLEFVSNAAPFPAKQSGRLRLEKRSRRVWVGSDEIIPPLSVSQFQLLEILAEQPGRVIPRKELIGRIWGDEEAIEVSEQALDALIRRLRDRLAEADPGHAYIVTVRGHGLRLENTPA